MAKAVKQSTGEGARGAQDLLDRLNELETLTRANHHELELQFQRIADMQVEIDKLKKQRLQRE